MNLSKFQLVNHQQKYHILCFFLYLYSTSLKPYNIKCVQAATPPLRTCRRYVSYLCQCRHSIGYHHGSGVREQLFEQIQESLVFHQLGVDVMKLGNTHSSSLAHVWIIVLIQTYHNSNNRQTIYGGDNERKNMLQLL